jgi:hypothetical protein
VRFAHLRGHGRPKLVNEVEQAAPVDDAAGADGQPARLADLLLQPVDQV